MPTVINDHDSLLLLLLKKVGSARLRESGIHPISLKNPAPQYQPIDRKKSKGKRVEDYSRDRAAIANAACYIIEILQLQASVELFRMIFCL